VFVRVASAAPSSTSFGTRRERLLASKRSRTRNSPLSSPPFPDGSWEDSLLSSGGGRALVVGVDEVGRGPLAGPVVAACVFFSAPVSRLSRLGIADSKSLSSDRRDELSRLIHTEADHVSLGWSSVDEVNELNVRQATFLAMNRALQQLPPFLMRDSRLCVAVDGRDKIPGVEIQQRTVVGGDRTVLSVAAASIVAKVARDSYMEKP